jgi:hypothetical protein
MMFERNYYYLVAGLPDLVLDQKKLPLSLMEFRDELEYHLPEGDFELVKLLFYQFDNQNLLNLLQKSKEGFIESGMFPPSMLEEEVKEPSALPLYMQQFIHAFRNESSLFENHSWENQLTWLHYEHLLATRNEFLAEWFEFDLNIRNILSAFNVRKFKLPKETAFIGDNFVAEALKRSTLKDFGLSNDFPMIEKLLSIEESDSVLEKEKAVDMLRWDFLNELNTFNYFTIEVLLAFVLKLMMVERWIFLDPETGRGMFKKMISELEKSYEFPKEFRLNEVRK